MYQRLMPDTSQTLQAIANRCLAEIEEAELQADRITVLEVALSSMLVEFENAAETHNQMDAIRTAKKVMNRKAAK
jgi:hypothetical protein